MVVERVEEVLLWVRLTLHVCEGRRGTGFASVCRVGVHRQGRVLRFEVRWSALLEDCVGGQS